MSTRTTWVILEGPSKLDLMLALFDGDLQHRRNVELVVSRQSGGYIGERCEVLINSVEREDGSGESWVIGGYIYPIEYVTTGKHSHDYRMQHAFSGYFSTKKREGRLTLK